MSEQEPLLYDFYGFPKHYYMEKFPNKGSTEIANRVIEVLGEEGINTQKEERGLDHGVFVPFKIMFDQSTNPVNVPIVQVSLFDNDRDAAAHIRLGRAVEKLRDENILLIMSGMAVHNLRDFMMSQRGAARNFPICSQLRCGSEESSRDSTRKAERREHGQLVAQAGWTKSAPDL